MYVFMVAAMAPWGVVACHAERGIAAARPGVVVDSALTLGEELRRFRATITPVPRELEPGYKSREALVNAWFRSVAARDTAVLASMHISLAEYGYFYFPFSQFASEPYRLPPAFVWFQITAGSNKGLTKAMQRISDRAAGYAGHECAADTTWTGPGGLWKDCTLRWHDAGGQHSGRLFGSIIERSGRFKFVSYANGL